MARAVRVFPWDRLPRVSRAALRAERRAREALSAVLVPGRLALAAGEVLSAEVRIEATPHAAARPHADSVFLRANDGSVTVAVTLEPALVSLVLARVLQRSEPITSPDTPSHPATRGALAAVLVEVARRTSAPLPLRALGGDSLPGESAARVDVIVRVDGRAYHASAAVYPEAQPVARGLPDTDLRALGGFPIRIPLVAAVSLADRGELAALRPRDVWLPGKGWLHADPDVTSNRGTPAERVLARAALCAPDGERGVEVSRSDGGRLVLRGDVIALEADVVDLEHRGDEAMSGTEETLTSIALDAPLVVRVEVGSVTLTARQWGELRPGDVLETGLRLAEPVVLRVAGREVARGELVEVDGELGVRIRDIVSREQGE